MAGWDDFPVVSAPSGGAPGDRGWDAFPIASAPPTNLVDRVTSAITERPLQTAADVAKWVAPNLIPGGQFLAPVIERAVGPERAPTVEHPDAQTIANLPIPGAFEPGMTFGKAMAAKFGPMFTSDPDEVERIILKNVPGTAAVKDSLGNRMIELDGKRYYLDMPGVTGMDVARAVGPAMIGVPATAAAAAAAPALGLGALGTAALVGGASGASSLAEDLLADMAGGEGGLKPGKAALAVILGGGGQMLLTRAMPKITQQAALEGLGLDDIFSAGGLTDRGLALFKRAGVDPGMFTPQQLQGVVSTLRAGMVDDAAAQAIQQATRQQVATEARIPLTRGQVTGDEAQLIIEDQMRQGAKGAPARRVLQRFGDDQAEAAQTAIDTTRRGLTTAVEPMTPSVAGDAIGSAWDSAARQLANTRNQAYEFTFTQPGVFDANAFRNTGDFIRQRLTDAAKPVILDDALTPNAVRALREAEGLGLGAPVNRALPKDDVLSAGAQPAGVSMQDIDRARRRMLAFKDAAWGKDRTDGRAASAVVQAFDDRVEAALRAGLFDGDPRVLDTLLGARSLHALWRERFGKQRDHMGLVNQFIATAAKEGRSGQDLFNALYGAGQLGSRQGAKAMMEHVTRVLGDNPEAMMALREGALHRMLGGIDTAGGQKATYGAMAKGIEQAMSGNGREVVDALFTGAERQQIQRLGSALQTLADSMNRRNPSGTSYPLLNFLRKQAGAGLGALIGHALGSKIGIPYAAEAGMALGAGAGNVIRDQLSAMAARRTTNYVPDMARVPVSQWLRSAAALPAIEAPTALEATLPARRAAGGRIGFADGGEPLGAIDRFGAVLRSLRAADTSPEHAYGPAPSLVPDNPYPIYYFPGQHPGGSGVAAPAVTGAPAGGSTLGVGSAGVIGTPYYDISGSQPSVTDSGMGEGQVGPTGQGLSADANAQHNVSVDNQNNPTSAIAAQIGRTVVGLLAPTPISIAMAAIARAAQMAHSNQQTSPSPQQTKSQDPTMDPLAPSAPGTVGVGDTTSVSANPANNNPSPGEVAADPGPAGTTAEGGGGGPGAGAGVGAGTGDDSTDGGTWKRGGIVRVARRVSSERRHKRASGRR
jgi:hypothetical protein